MAKRATRLLPSIMLTMSLGVATPTTPFAYSFNGYKMHNDIWYQASAVFCAVSVAALNFKTTKVSSI